MGGHSLAVVSSFPFPDLLGVTEDFRFPGGGHGTPLQYS